MRFYLELGGVAATLQTIDNRAETIYLQQGAADVMEYRGESKTIVIDSSSALRVGDGMVQTPALGLLHEAGHALHDLEDHKQFLLNIRTPDTAFDNKEERNVIENIENPAARTLKEPTRATIQVHRYKLSVRVAFSDGGPRETALSSLLACCVVGRQFLFRRRQSG